MKHSVLIDTGPLVAFLSASDQYHAWAVERFKELRPPLLTCDAVISEVCFLLSTYRPGIDRLLGDLESGAIQLSFNLAAESSRIHRLMRRYADYRRCPPAIIGQPR